MTDGLGRNIDYIRISVTDRCNLRCVYCMPEEGVKMMSHGDTLSFEEIIRLCTVFAQLGIKKIKLTGGEPLCRLGITDLVRELKSIDGIEQVTMTTNAVELDKYLIPLYEAGLDGINISLDTLDRGLFRKITRRDRYDDVMTNLKSAVEFGKIPVKINCVPMSGEQELLDVAALARDSNVHVRFIEMMPIGFGKEYNFYSQDDIAEMLETSFGELKPVSDKLGNGPAEYYSLPGFVGRIGFISAMSHKFCNLCNRVRLTSAGFLKTCLQYDTGADLRECLRSGGTDEQLLEIIRRAILTKPVSHHFDRERSAGDEERIMSQIGG